LGVARVFVLFFVTGFGVAETDESKAENEGKDGQGKNQSTWTQSWIEGKKLFALDIHD